MARAKRPKRPGKTTKVKARKPRRGSGLRSSGVRSISGRGGATTIVRT